MSNDQHKLDSLLAAASGIESIDERAAFLQSACGDDQQLRQRLEQLLHTAAQVGQQSAELDATIIPDPSVCAPQAQATSDAAEDHSAKGSTANHSVLNALSQTVNVPRVLLRDDNDDDPIVRPSSPEVPHADADSRYRLDGEIARGGMGMILKGRDTDLGRDLAIKVLLDSHKDKPEVIQRFIEEAQIGGQLQHPGIAPIYELGQFADQRPFFSMKLVKGKTLARLLADREDATADRAKLLGIFEQICQTMAYAHSRGVIHRDLKPANIMVGAFGEVQVMDWGLAKVLSSGGVADEKAATLKQRDVSIIQTMRSMGSEVPGSFGSNGSETQMGSVMGTPAYMPPEQALGEIDQLDQRTDVFGLGAILCEILTGQPPYVGKNGTEVFRLASRGKLNDAFARLDACGADPELLALTKHCLELEPAQRPIDGAALAQSISRYLEAVETRLRDTELAKVDAQARAEEIAQRQKLAYRSGAAIAATLLIGIAVSGWQAVRATRAESQATIAASTAEEEAKRAIAAELETKNSLKQVAAERDAKDQARQNAEAVSTFLTEVFQSPDPARDGRTITVAETLDAAAQKLQTELTDQPERRAKLQATLAETYFALGLYQDAVKLQEQVRDGYMAMSGPEQPETLTAMHHLANSLVRAGRPDEALQIQEKVLKARRTLLGSQHPETLESMHALAVSYFHVGRREEALNRKEEVLKLSRAVLGEDAPLTLKIMPALAVSYVYAGRRDEAMQMAEETLRLCRTVYSQQHPSTLLAMNNLASHYYVAGRKDEALLLREEVLKLSRKVLGQEHPRTLLVLQNLATSYSEVERSQEAYQMFQEVLRIRKKVLGDEHPATLGAKELLANFEFKSGRIDEAISLQLAVLTIRERDRGSKNIDTLNSLAQLASFYYQAGRNDEAITAYERLIKAKYETPDAPNAAAANSATLNAVAWPLVKAPNQNDEFPLAEQATQWARQACELAPDDGNLLNTLGVALYRQQKWQEAIKTFQKSISLGADIPDNWLYLAMAHWHLDEKPEAQKWYQKSLAWKTANTDPIQSNPDQQQMFTEARQLMTTDQP